MGKVELLGLVSELDRLIGAVGAGTLNLSQTAEKIKGYGRCSELLCERRELSRTAYTPRKSLCIRMPDRRRRLRRIGPQRVSACFRRHLI